MITVECPSTYIGKPFFRILWQVVLFSRLEDILNKGVDERLELRSCNTGGHVEDEQLSTAERKYK